MNDSTSAAGRLQCPAMVRWGSLVWLIALNALPYLFTALAAGEFDRVMWVIWSLLSGPFALVAMLSFLMVAGEWPIMLRRIVAVSGALLLVGLLMLFLEEEIVGASAWFLLEAAIVITLTLLSCCLLNLPRPPKRWSLQFSLSEIAILSGLVGVFLFLLRLAEATDYQFWKQSADLPFITFTMVSAVLMVPACLATIATSRRAIFLWIGGSLLLWIVIPLLFLAIMTGFRWHQLGFIFLLMILYPVLGFQLLLVWGTLFPIRIFFPSVLFPAEATPAATALDTPGTLADAPPSCPQTEHTDVPD